jgi:ComEC/Rec2-related protein
LNTPANIWRRQPFVGIALAAMLGVAVADLTGIHPPIAAIGLLVVAAAAAIAIRRSLVTYLFVAAAFFCLHTLHLRDLQNRDLTRFIGSGIAAVSVQGTVLTEPKVSPRGVGRFVTQLSSVDVDGVTHKTSARVLARWKGAARYGDELTLFGTAEPIPPPRNPGEFDMKSYLARQGITRELIVRYPENGSVIRHSSGNVILAAAQRSRAWLQRVLCRGLDDSREVEAAITGMALGIRHQTPDDIEEPFQQTGTLHLFAVAGLHVGIVAQLLWIVARLARLPRKWATAFIIVALFFYSAVTGLHTSSVRAAIMSAVLLSGFFVERKVFALNSLAAAATLILCWDTNELFAIGFQLSFAVVSAIILIADPAFLWLQRLRAPDAFLPRSLLTGAQRAMLNVWRWIARGVSVSFGAWVGSFPLMLVYYNLVTPISVFANLAVVPIAFFVLAGALLSIIAAPFSASLSVVFNNANWLLTRTILALVHIFAQLPTGHLYVEHPHWPTGARVDITALDVGTGGAIHIRTARRDWLVDCGRARDFNRTVRPYLRSRGVNHLETLLLTHADAGHIGGALNVIDLFRPNGIIDFAAPARSRVNHELIERLSDRKLQHVHATAGAEWPLARDTGARVLFPRADFQADSADDQAIVLQLAVDGIPRVLITSDSGVATEKALIDSGQNLRADVLIKGQHRSGESGSAEFLEAVHPNVIIATSRDFPENERIKDEWESMVAARRIKLFRQDQTGAVRVLVWKSGQFEVRPYLTPDVFRKTSR